MFVGLILGVLFVTPLVLTYLVFIRWVDRFEPNCQCGQTRCIVDYYCGNECECDAEEFHSYACVEPRIFADTADF